MQKRNTALFKRILVPLDGSGLAERALEPAIRMAQADDAELILLRIAAHKGARLSEGGVYSYLRWNELVESEQQEAVDYLERVEQTKIPRAVPARVLVLDGDEAGAIVDTAASEDVDLIIMSTHGRSGPRRWILGSVTEKVLREAPCPVLVIRPEDELAAPRKVGSVGESTAHIDRAG
ncbi:MAG: universal stress protein [Chloroflexota bacterium]